MRQLVSQKWQVASNRWQVLLATCNLQLATCNQRTKYSRLLHLYRQRHCFATAQAERGDATL